MISPIGNRIIVSETPVESVSAGGIYIPEAARGKTAALKANVLAVGPGRVVKGVRQEIPLQRGDTVLIPTGAGALFNHEGDQVRILDADLVLGVVEEG